MTALLSEPTLLTGPILLLIGPILLLIGVLLLPLCGALALSVSGCLRGLSLPFTRHFSLFVIGLVLVCALALPLYGERDVHLPLTWIPGTGDLSLHVGGAGVYALIVTAICAFLLRLFMPDPDLGAENRTLILWIDVLWLIALAATNAAFLAGHFLGRYVVLEVVGLCVAALPLLQRREAAASRFVYIVLRIGDAGLLAAILALMQASGTLSIAEALHAGESLDAPRLGWVAAGFLLAVWVKMGAWPFQDWLRAGDLAESSAGTWLYGIVMPNLGLYLLYRVAPLLLLSAPLRLGVSALGLAGALLMAFRLVSVRDRRALPVYANAILSGVLLLLAAGGAQAWLGVWLWAGTPLRLGAWWLWQTRVHHQPASPIEPDPDRWLFRIAESIRWIENGVFERGSALMLQQAVTFAVTLQRVVEQDGIEMLVRAAARGTRFIARRMQQGHTGRLRQNLAWVVLAWVLVVVWLAVRGW